jgi:SlyX protein
MQMNEERIIELETKLAHQELAIEELQNSVFEQQRTIEAMEKALKQVTDQLKGVGASDIGPGNEKPPHY